MCIFVATHSSQVYIVCWKVMILVMSVCLFTGGCFPCDHYPCCNLSVWDPNFSNYYMTTPPAIRESTTNMNLFKFVHLEHLPPTPRSLLNKFWNMSMLVGASLNMDLFKLGTPLPTWTNTERQFHPCFVFTNFV